MSRIECAPSISAASIGIHSIFAPALLQDLVPGLRVGDALADLLADGAGIRLRGELAPLDLDRGGVVEGAEDRRVVLEPQRAEEDGGRELPLPVDADVQDVLLVVLELDPRAAVRDDLGHEGRLARVGLVEDAGAAMELADDDPLGAVDDERPVLVQHRDLAEVDLLLLDVADAAHLGVRVLVVDDELDRDLQGNGERLPALLALVDVVLELERDRIAALLAFVDHDRRQVPAAVAQHLAAERVGGDEALAAVDALAAQVLDPDQLAALAFPVADRVVDELQGAGLAEVLDREDRLEDGLQPRALAIGRGDVHLQEALVRALLDLDQIRHRDRRPNARELDPFRRRGLEGLGHRCSNPFRDPWKRRVPGSRSRRRLSHRTAESPLGPRPDAPDAAPQETSDAIALT
jgi:hypothetical protein